MTSMDVIERDGEGNLAVKGAKVVGPPARKLLNRWVERPRGVHTAPPLKSALNTYTSTLGCDTLAEGGLGYMWSNGSDAGHSDRYLFFLSSPYGNAHGWSLTPANLRKSVVLFAVRKAVKHSWLNDHDQFTAPRQVCSPSPDPSADGLKKGAQLL